MPLGKLSPIKLSTPLWKSKYHSSLLPLPAANNCVPVVCGVAAPALSKYTLIKYVDPNSADIQSVEFVFQVRFGVAVASAVHSTVAEPLPESS